MKNPLSFAVLIRSKVNLNGKFGIYFYAIIFGILAAFIAYGFQYLTHLILSALTLTDGHRVVETFSTIAPWRRIMSLSLGGIISGCILWFVATKVKKKATPYMEAVAIGNGYIPIRASLLRSLAAIITIGSGTSIGREGPLVQTVTVFASMFGRWTNLSVPRLRLLIACAASGAMSAVFHTPLAGGLFVCEIVIGIMSIDVLAPLLVASCASYVTIGLIGDISPLYKISEAYLNVNPTILLSICLLAIISSLLAKFWLFLLSFLRKALNKSQKYLPLRLALAGIIVGVLTIWVPDIVGNGAHIIRGIISMHYSFDDLILLLLLKVFAVSLFFGMGAVGGVLTPSLTIGSIAGFLFANILILCGVPLTQEEVIGFSILGMAAFFTTAAGAPLTSLVLVIEFTTASQMIFPLIVGVLLSYGASKVLMTKSMYESATTGAIKDSFNRPLNKVKIVDIFKKAPQTITPTTIFKTIAKIFIKTPDYAIFVVSQSNKYLGAVLEKDVLNFVRSDVLLSNVLAVDIMRTDIPKLSPNMRILEGIDIFSNNRGYEALPIIDDAGVFQGVVNRADIFMCFNEIVRRDKIGI